jgi:hypothetical protein
MLTKSTTHGEALLVSVRIGSHIQPEEGDPLGRGLAGRQSAARAIPPLRGGVARAER